MSSRMKGRGLMCQNQGVNPTKGTTILHENEHSDLNISYIKSKGIMRREG